MIKICLDGALFMLLSSQLSKIWFYCSESKFKENVDGIDTENIIILEKLKQNQRKDYLQVIMTSCQTNI